MHEALAISLSLSLPLFHFATRTRSMPYIVEKLNENVQIIRFDFAEHIFDLVHPEQFEP